MQSISVQTAEKLRGGYYTPDPVADFLVRWAVRNPADRVLEPSCGDGAFLRSLLRLPSSPQNLLAVEIDGTEASKASGLTCRMPGWNIVNTDFLEYAYNSDERFDAVVGNPPYIRYQFLPDSIQERMRSIYERNGLPFTKHCNAWSPFVVESVNHLVPGGRLAMVVPAELLNVINSGGLREHLLRECSKIMVVDPQPLLFEEALQGTLLLLAIRKDGDGDCSLSIRTCGDLGFLGSPIEDLFPRESFDRMMPSPSKWMWNLLTSQEKAIYDYCVNSPAIKRFDKIATLRVGIVTGANDFFLVDDEVVKRYQLESYVRPMFGRSSHAPGIIYDTANQEFNRRKGMPANFIDFNGMTWEELSDGARAYIRYGESLGLNKRYKCRIRDPWYAVPSVETAPVALLKRAHHIPRLIWNKSGAYTTDTAYRIVPKVDAIDLTVSWLNSLTALAVELGGRSYGGGVLELVPSEIRSLPLPLFHYAKRDAMRIDKALKNGIEVDGQLALQNMRLSTACGITVKDIEILDEARRRLMRRRLRGHV